MYIYVVTDYERCHHNKQLVAHMHTCMPVVVATVELYHTARNNAGLLSLKYRMFC